MSGLLPIVPHAPGGDVAADASQADDALPAPRSARHAPHEEEPPALSPDALAAAAQWLQQQALPEMDPGPLACQDLSASPSVGTATLPADDALPDQREHILAMRPTDAMPHAPHGLDAVVGALQPAAAAPGVLQGPTAASESARADGDDDARTREARDMHRTDAG